MPPMVGVPALEKCDLRPVVAHHLADLAALQALDHPRPDEHGQRERGDHREDRAHGQVREDVESRVVRRQLFGEPVEHVFLVRCRDDLSTADQRLDHALEPGRARTLDQHAHFARELGVDRARQRLGVREPFRARAEGLDRELRQLAGGEQPVDAVLAREAADLAMTVRRRRSPSSPMSPMTSQRRASTLASTSIPAFIELGFAL